MSTHGKKPSIRFGCQTYTWQMSLEKYRGKIEHIASVIAKSGMPGIEPELCMLDAFAGQPERLRECLQAQGVTMAALCLVCDWRGAKETPAERAQAGAAIALLADYFPDTLLALCQMPGPDRANLEERQENALACVNAVAARAAGAGLNAAFHPNSPTGSVFKTELDYQNLLKKLDFQVVGFAPDAGHIAKGGMDPVEIFRRYASSIRHVHFKDMDASGNWVEMGRGCIDFHGILEVLKQANYKGWIMVEDESALAERDPNAATIWNGQYVQANFAQET